MSVAISRPVKQTSGVVCSVAMVIAIVVGHGKVRTNAEGLALIGNAEGCRTNPYVCPAGILTDGIGNTHGVRRGVVKTLEEIARDWEKNILDAEWCVNQYANGRRLPDEVFSAAVSLTFRVGCGKVRNSTIFRMLLAGPGSYVEACHQLPRWKWSNGEIMPGLVIRSLKEESLCLKGAKK